VIEKRGSQRPANIPLLFFVDRKKENGRRIKAQNEPISFSFRKKKIKDTKHDALTWQKRIVFNFARLCEPFMSQRGTQRIL